MDGEYYVVPLGVVLRGALPAALTGAERARRRRRRRAASPRSRSELPSLMQRDRIFARAPQQRALYELLESLGGRAAVEHLLEQLSFSPSVLKGLVARDLVTIEHEVVARDPFASRAPQRAPTPHTPSPAQQARHRRAGGAVRRATCSCCTASPGSGKTLVYIELLRASCDERGQTAIVLVPEIALTPQTVDRFRAVFGDRVAVLHSALSDGERYDAWLALRRGEKRIAVGARSAIFAPLANLGAIIVDEEHESSYKQGEAPRYHAREVAIVRARAEGAVVVLGSATPSLESWTNAAAGKYRALVAAGARGRRTAAEPSRSSTCDATPRRESAGAAAMPFTLVISEPLERRSRDRLAKRRAEHPAAQPPRLCVVRAVRVVRRRRRRVPNCRSAHVPPHARAAGLSLLPARGAAARRAASAAAATRCASAGWARSRWSVCSRSAIRRRASRAWTSTRRAASGRTPTSSTASGAARSTSCSARR